MTHRVTVTGWGVVSSIGHTAGAYWSNLSRGVSGIADATIIPTDHLAQKVVAEVKNFDPHKYFDDRQVTTLDRVSQFAVVAAREAIGHASISFGDGLSQKTATIGTGVGGRRRKMKATSACIMSVQNETTSSPYHSEADGERSSEPSFYALRSERSLFAVASACASATHAIGLAFHLVRSGGATCAVTGGSDACITFGTMKGWEAMRVMAPDTCRPFSRDRKGMVIGEGAAIVVLESLEHARKRSARVLGEIVGFGMSSDASDLLSPDEGGMVRAFEGALADGRLSPGDIQYVNAHGTGTTANDDTETQAIKRTFGQ
jgi:nodulation protein E